jgi:predicted nucleotidyltransferase
LNGEKVFGGRRIKSHGANSILGLRYAAAGYKINYDIARTLHSARFFIDADAA